jgi:signal transduction histidine kinase
MKTGERADGSLGVRRLRIAASFVVASFFGLIPHAHAFDRESTSRVLILYPGFDGQPGIVQFDQSFRSSFRSSSREKTEVYNEFLDAARFPDDRYQKLYASFLRQKYADRNIGLIIAGLPPSLDFVLKYRDELLPGVPVVYATIEQREVKARDLGPGVVGVPMKVELGPTLEAALRLHPRTRHVVVVAGRSKLDAYWTAEARETFRGYEGKVDFVYLVGLPMDDLLRRVARLPDESLIYYLNLFEDGHGRTFIPADVVESLSTAANAPVYGHFGSYLGRGIVGGRITHFEAEGETAARLALRVLSGERPESMTLPEASGNPSEFDWRQLRRWGIGEDALPPGSVVLYKQPSLWDLYRWHVIGVASLCLIETLLIVGLLLERANRRRAKERLRESQRELRALSGRLLQAQETERRRIARELHDDLNQDLALLAVQMDLLGRRPPDSGARLGEEMKSLSDRVKQLSSTVHGLSSLLHPAKLEQLGLVPAVRSLCKELAQAHGLTIEFVDGPVPPTIPADTALCLYRVVQEALQNAIKHGGARHARIDLSGEDGGVSLRIADDGVGFDPAKAERKGGLGLVSMRERLHLVGGVIAVESGPSAGTRIDVRVPLGTAAPEADARRSGSAGLPSAEYPPARG